MKISEITRQSKARAEDVAKNNGGFLVPIYAVVKADENGRVMSVTHDHLNDVNFIEKNK